MFKAEGQLTHPYLAVVFMVDRWRSILVGGLIIGCAGFLVVAACHILSSILYMPWGGEWVGPSEFHYVYKAAICAWLGGLLTAFVGYCLWEQKTSRSRRQGHCSVCDYDLRGQPDPNQGRCPECGLEITASPK
jgi:hypothetical protein